MCELMSLRPFSILERIVVVETFAPQDKLDNLLPFSILERIVVVETLDASGVVGTREIFQYPRTDRGG